ncbi:MAG TPA: hypothetical protein VFW98_01105 [Gemmatimonadaceae bacterium]|nr:hypothetical protein [Gemmatimonadaceae bacterium]
MSFDTMSPTPRRGFLGRLAGAAVALGVAGVAPLRLMAEPAAPQRGQDVEDWPGTLRGKHRQVFDAVSPNDGFALLFAHVFLMTNSQASKIPEHDLNGVIVLRHEAAPLALTDAVWKKYALGEAVKATDPATKAPAVRNPYYHARPGDLPILDASIEKLQARGVKFGVCNVALTILSGTRAAAAGVSPDQAKTEWMAALIPGVTVLPSGVWGVNRAQEHGCSYCYAG